MFWVTRVGSGCAGLCLFVCLDVAVARSDTFLGSESLAGRRTYHGPQFANFQPSPTLPAAAHRPLSQEPNKRAV